MRDYALGIDIEESNDEERKAEIEKLAKEKRSQQLHFFSVLLLLESFFAIL